MPNVRVTCPECRSELEIDAQFEGQEIECGGCLKVFVAKVDTLPDRAEEQSNWDKVRARRRRDRRRDENNYEPRYAPSNTNGVAVASLVLGILSVVMIVLTLPLACCCPFLTLPLTIPFSLSATLTGAFGVRKREGKGMAVAGLTLGALCLGFTILQLAFGLLPFMAPPRPAQ